MSTLNYSTTNDDYNAINHDYNTQNDDDDHRNYRYNIQNSVPGTALLMAIVTLKVTIATAVLATIATLKKGTLQITTLKITIATLQQQ